MAHIAAQSLCHPGVRFFSRGMNKLTSSAQRGLCPIFLSWDTAGPFHHLLLSSVGVSVGESGSVAAQGSDFCPVGLREPEQAKRLQFRSFHHSDTSVNAICVLFLKHL